MSNKIERLIKYCQGVYNQGDGQALYQMYLADIQSITPEELIQVQSEQLKHLSASDMLTYVDKLMNVFYKSLSEYRLNTDLPKFIQTLLDENDELEKKLDDFKGNMSDLDSLNKEDLKAFIEEMKGYNAHLEKLENIVFSSLEQVEDHFSGLKIMWALHDKIRQALKTLDKSLETSTPRALVVELGELYFLLYGAVLKQNFVLFPVAIKRLKEDDFERMYHESFEYGFSYIEAPEQVVKPKVLNAIEGLLQTDTGNLEFDTLISILSILPIDFTFVDEHDEVKFYNDTPDRIFPRSKSIIGRKVHHCHPPQSVHIVEEIVNSFKNGTKDKAEFWIKMKGLMVYIYYVPIRDGQGNYKGTLEISQEISGLRALEGERRLLDWS